VALFSAAPVAFNILHALDRYLTAARWVGPLGVRVPPNQGNRRYGPAEQRAELQQARQAGIVAGGFVGWLTP
jgi:hypothetical protein